MFIYYNIVVRHSVYIYITGIIHSPSAEWDNRQCGRHATGPSEVFAKVRLRRKHAVDCFETCFSYHYYTYYHILLCAPAQVKCQNVITVPYCVTSGFFFFFLITRV